MRRLNLVYSISNWPLIYLVVGLLDIGDIGACNALDGLA